MKRMKVFVAIIFSAFVIVLSLNNYLVEYENKELGSPSQEIAKNEYGFIPLEKLPNDYPVEKAVEDGVINISNGGIDNGEKFIEFFENIRNDKACMIRTLQYTTEGDPVYTDIIFHSESPDQPYFDFQEKNSPAMIYHYIVSDGKDIYLSNEIEYSKSSTAIPICHTALGIDKHIWDNAFPIIEHINTYPSPQN